MRWQGHSVMEMFTKEWPINGEMDISSTETPIPSMVTAEGPEGMSTEAMIVARLDTVIVPWSNASMGVIVTFCNGFEKSLLIWVLHNEKSRKAILDVTVLFVVIFYHANDSHNNISFDFFELKPDNLKFKKWLRPTVTMNMYMYINI